MKLGDGLAGIFAGSGMVEGLNYVIKHSQSLAYQRNNTGQTPFYLAALRMGIKTVSKYC